MKAFPKTSRYDENNGMDLRDYFAAKAMQSSLLKNTFLNEKEIAECSYLMADAMMKARKQ
jgi:hypothetical protein